MQINDIAAVVTGGASGLGGATARMLADQGAKVTIFDMNEDIGAKHASEIGAKFVRVDVSDEENVRDGLDEAESAHGVARILVNCAGILIAKKTTSKGKHHALASFAKVIAVNLIGTFNCITQMSTRLCKAEPVGEERGVIINTSSVAAFDGQIGQAAYSASKGGTASMTLPIARDLADECIRVVSIAPGLFLTPMLMGLSEEVRESLGNQVPFPNRLGEPSEYAQLARSIIENPMLNGETIRLDGAVRLAPR